MKVRKIEMPHASFLQNTSYEYADSFTTEFFDKDEEINILEVAKAFLSGAPAWVERLFSLRNKIVAVFGLKTSDTLASRKEVLDNFNGDVGEKVGIFKVFDRSAQEIILGEDDLHLNFRVSLLLTSKEKDKQNVSISTTVHFNNWMGKLYFLPVKPFHRLIVPVMLKKTMMNLAKCSHYRITILIVFLSSWLVRIFAI